MSAALSLSSAAREGLKALNESGPRLIEDTIAWSTINSGSLELAGLARMSAVLEQAFASLPGAIERLALPPTTKIRADGAIEPRAHGDALRLQVRPNAPIQIALTGHYDTVFPAAHPFQTPRRLDNDILNGPGVADMKGGLRIMLAALEAFEQTPGKDRIGYTVLLSPDEEIGSPASAALLAELGAKSHLGMTYEPALPDGRLAGARKGSGNYALIFKGRATHVGRAFADGRSAVLAAADAALRLDSLNGKVDGVTVNIGAIDGGGPTNVVPDRAVLRFNIRAPDPEARDWAIAELDKIVLAAGARDGVEAALDGSFARPPKPMTKAFATMLDWTKQAGGAIGLDLAWAPTGGVCEGNNLAAAGCPNVDTLGVRGANLHSDQEYALLSSFAERAQLSFLLLCGLADGAFDPVELTS
jgi:glutamate carboxypeptidase